MANKPDPWVSSLLAIFDPLVNIAKDPELGAELLTQLGYDPKKYEAFLELCGKDNKPAEWLTNLMALFKSLAISPSLGVFVELMRIGASLASEMTQKVKAIKDAGAALPQDPDEFVADLLALFMDNWLLGEFPLVHDLLAFLGVLRYEERAQVQVGPDNEIVRMKHTATVFDWPRFATLVQDPGMTLKKQYLLDKLDGPSASDAAKKSSALLFPALGEIIETLGGLATESPDGRDLTLWMVTPDYDSQVGIALRLLAKTEGGPGARLKLVDFPSLDLDDIDGWAIRLSAEGVSGDTPELTLSATGVSVSGVNKPLAVRVEVAQEYNSDAGALVLGGRQGTRLELGGIGLTGRIACDGKGEPDYGGAVAFDRARIVVAAGDGDGFLKTVLPQEGVLLDLRFKLGWSRNQGVHFDGGAGLDITLPVHKDILGVLTLRTAHLRLSVLQTGATLWAGTSIDLMLGPVAATVENVGIELDAPFDKRGLTARFAPPTGVGLAIDAGALKGAGFLSIDAAAGRYAGSLMLHVSDLQLAAIGLLHTKLPPGGEEGFSLLVLITARFPAIQLGFGFTLNAVGGLIGIHRTLAVGELRKRVLGGGADALLFPDDPMKQANALVKTLGSVFPAARDRHVVAPMLELGWGTPSLIHGKLAVILELPTPIRLSLLGALRATIPDTKPVIALKLDVLGVLDLERKTLAIDASLFDSRVAILDIYGDAAIRLCWGAEPNFALSVGGLHPRFKAPPGFPGLRRVCIALGVKKSPRLSLVAYLAVTSNTLQMGARALVYAELFWDLKISGHLAFDALIIFEPFRFEVDISAAVALKHKSTELFMIELRGVLAGPEPWHVRGFARFKFIVEHKVPVEARFGHEAQPRHPLSGTDVWKLLQKEVSNKGRWSTGASGEGDPGGEQVWNPGAVLVFRQASVPLGRKLEKFGAGPVKGAARFDLDRIEVGREKVNKKEWLIEQEPFAASMFEELSDDERLSRPSFEKMDAGFRFASHAIKFGGERRWAPEMETIHLRTLYSPPGGKRHRGAADSDLVTALGRVGAASRTPGLRSSSAALNGGVLPAPVSLADDNYAVLKEDGSIAAKGVGKGAALNMAGPMERVVPQAELGGTS